MNHLAHLALADGLPAAGSGLLVGGFLGDYVKGRLKGDYPEEVELGIRLHRAIDAFTDQHPVVRSCQARFPADLRRYAGIITDIAYDHLLALTWHTYYAQSVDDFSRQALSTLHDHAAMMPSSAAKTAERMHAHNSLAGYREREFVKRSLGYLGSRLTRQNPLAESFPVVEFLMPQLEEDFASFYPRLIDFCDQWMNNQ